MTPGAVCGVVIEERTSSQALLPATTQAVQPGSRGKQPSISRLFSCSVKGNLLSRAGLSFSLFYLSTNNTKVSSEIPLPPYVTVYNVN